MIDPQLASAGGMRSAKGTRDNSLELLKEMEDRIIIKFRKRINQLERKFVDDLASKSFANISGEKADLNKTIQPSSANLPVSILASKLYQGLNMHR